MMNTATLHPVFREGDDVVLAEGTYQGTAGVFLRLKTDTNWADVEERNGRIRTHPVAWLAHSQVAKHSPANSLRR